MHSHSYSSPHSQATPYSSSLYDSLLRTIGARASYALGTSWPTLVKRACMIQYRAHARDSQLGAQSAAATFAPSAMVRVEKSPFFGRRRSFPQRRLRARLPARTCARAFVCARAHLTPATMSRRSQIPVQTATAATTMTTTANAKATTMTTTMMIMTTAADKQLLLLLLQSRPCPIGAQKITFWARTERRPTGASCEPPIGRCWPEPTGLRGGHAR